MLEGQMAGGAVLQNSTHSLPPDAQRVLHGIQADRMEALARRDRAMVASRPSAEDWRRLRALDEAALRVDRAEADAAAALYRERALAVDWMGPDALPLAPLDFAPRAAGAEFWWAETQAWQAGGISAQFLADGLHLFGRVDYDRDPLFRFNVGAVARFDLSPERRPPSSSGRYRSQPFVELFGAVQGWTNLQHCPWACDDKWSKCFLFLRQSVVQFVDDVGNWQLLGEATSHRTLIDEEGNGVGVTAPLPGFLPIPTLEFSLARPDRAVIVDLEVRFDVMLEGSSFIGFSPGNDPSNSVLLRHFQWPCLPA